MSFLLFSQPLETSLKISQYDPEKLNRPKASKKRPPTGKHLLSYIDTQTSAHRNLQESDLRALTEIPMAGTPGDALGPEACEVSTDQLMRQEIQHDPSIARIRGVSPGLHTADQHTLGAESDHAQVESRGRQNPRRAPN